MSEIKLLSGDCLDLIKDIADKSVDLIVTDPPYCIGTTSNGKQGSWQDNNLIRPFFEQLFEQYRRVLKEDGALYINTDWRTYPFLFPLLQKQFAIKNLIVWDYEWIKAGSHYRFSHEFIIYATAPMCKSSFSRSERDVWRIRPINFTDKNKLHNAQKPVELYEKAINNSSEKGNTILDTFMGSGTVGVACFNLGRNYIGMEIDENYFQIAQKRLGEIQSQIRLEVTE